MADKFYKGTEPILYSNSAVECSVIAQFEALAVAGLHGPERNRQIPNRLLCCRGSRLEKIRGSKHSKFGRILFIDSGRDTMENRS